MAAVTVVDHPFVQDSLMHLRRKDTELQKFRHHSDKICELLFYEAVRSLSLAEVPIETPLTAMKAKKLVDEVVIVPVLRSGLAMLPGAMKFLPKSKIGFVGMERDEDTAVARQYYWKLPPIGPETVVVITDPMLATGGSILYVLNKVARQKPKEIIITCVIAAPEGVKKIRDSFPGIKIFAAALDERLNGQKYIVPGIGDYGDRYFGTV
jgi:uracil phosphoribosyltransferase